MAKNRVDGSIEGSIVNGLGTERIAANFIREKASEHNSSNTISMDQADEE